MLVSQWVVYGGNGFIRWKLFSAAHLLMLSASCDENGRSYKFFFPSESFAALWVQHRTVQYFVEYVDENASKEA